jgi:cell division septation protein DedD
MAENRKDTENGAYYVSKTQVVVVATGFAATCVLVFLLGILVGQGIEERKLMKQEEPLVKVPLQPLAPGAKSAPGAPAKDELTFYDTLAKTSGPQAPASAPAKEAKPAEKASKQAEKASKPEAQEAKEPKPEVKEAPDTKPATKEIKTAKTSAAAEAPAQKTKENGEKSAATEDAKNGKTEAAPTAKAGQETSKVAQETPKAAQDVPKAASKAAQEEKAKSDASGRAWAVQVNAYPEESRAQRLVERLKEKGYDAYVVTANVKGKDWYRVRVGHFGTRSQTKGLLEEIQTKENFPKAIAVSK